MKSAFAELRPTAADVIESALAGFVAFYVARTSGLNDLICFVIVLICAGSVVPLLAWLRKESPADPKHANASEISSLFRKNEGANDEGKAERQQQGGSHHRFHA